MIKKHLHFIDQLIMQLTWEINSRIPFPNKDRKQLKLDALQKLKTELSQPTSLFAGAVEKVCNEYPDARLGKISKRTAELFDVISKMNDLENKQLITY